MSDNVSEYVSAPIVASAVTTLMRISSLPPSSESRVKIIGMVTFSELILSNEDGRNLSYTIVFHWIAC